MEIPNWDKLTIDQKYILSRFFDQQKWDDSSQDERLRFVDFALIGDLLTAPTIERGLPLYRQWELPAPENESLD